MMEEEFKLTYHQEGDYLIPDLEVDEEPEEDLTKYGLMRWDYLEKNKPLTFNWMRAEIMLKEHCLTIQHQAEERKELLMEQMKKREGVNEELKAENWMEYVQKLNMIEHQAEEIVLAEIVYGQ